MSKRNCTITKNNDLKTLFTRKTNVYLFNNIKKMNTSTLLKTVVSQYHISLNNSNISLLFLRLLSKLPRIGGHLRLYFTRSPTPCTYTPAVFMSLLIISNNFFFGLSLAVCSFYVHYLYHHFYLHLSSYYVQTTPVGVLSLPLK